MASKRISLRFESDLHAPADRVWEWITSVEGISAEMWPLLRMTFPRGMRSLGDAPAGLGVRLCRSWLLLFGVLPVDYSDLTLVELEEGKGFVEQSPMGSMKTWRHERTIAPSASGTRLTDRLTFEPRFAAPVVRALVKVFFKHRHAVLKRRLSTLKSI